MSGMTEGLTPQGDATSAHSQTDCGRETALSSALRQNERGVLLHNKAVLHMNGGRSDLFV